MRIQFRLQSLLLLALMLVNQSPCDSIWAQELAGQRGADSFSGYAGNSELEACISPKFNFVYRIGDFYILGTDERPRESDRDDRQGKEVVLQAVRLFGSFLDSNEDGKYMTQDYLKVLVRTLLLPLDRIESYVR